VVLASSVTGENTQETVTDKGEASLSRPAPASGGMPDASGEGTVTKLLYGLQGQVNGALLDSGLIIRMPRDVPIAQTELFAVGQHIAVSGEEFDTEYGNVIRIDSLGASDNELSPVRQIGFELPALPSP
jgi:hypothetical protein